MNRLLQGWKHTAGWLARRTGLRGWRPRLAILAIVSGLYLVNALEFVERRYLDLRFGLLERPASGEVVLVEIDPQSLRGAPYRDRPTGVVAHSDREGAFELEAPANRWLRVRASAPGRATVARHRRALRSHAPKAGPRLRGSWP